MTTVTVSTASDKRDMEDVEEDTEYAEDGGVTHLAFN